MSSAEPACDGQESAEKVRGRVRVRKLQQLLLRLAILVTLTTAAGAAAAGTKAHDFMGASRENIATTVLVAHFEMTDVPAERLIT